MPDVPKLSDMQLSALAEVGGIGSGHAAIALSQLLGRKIMVTVSKVQIAKLEEFEAAMGGKDTLITGIYLNVLGDTQGSILLVFGRKSAFRLVDVLLNQKQGTTKILSEMEQSALKEAGSILSASYLNALSDLMSISLIPSVPRMVCDKVSVVFNSIFEELLRKSDITVGIETEFIETTTRIKGHFLFMPDIKGLEALLNALGV